MINIGHVSISVIAVLNFRGASWKILIGRGRAAPHYADPMAQQAQAAAAEWLDPDKPAK